jgi:adenylylsulfate kinase-like enzyme/SAM-dependent methyltransferase
LETDLSTEQDSPLENWIPFEAQPAVFWITGFSGSGKTTVGRKLKSKLNDMKVNAIFLDGDDLRGIFGGKWGYERTDRIELSHAYFRLCNTLSAQGKTVIISAVSMYNEIYSWVKENIDHSFQIYLKVPEHERIKRDSNTKNIYGSIGDITKLYDEPSSPDITIENYGSTTPDEAASYIIEAYQASFCKGVADKGRTEHWNSFYTGDKLVFEPSDFAITVQSKLHGTLNLLEMGCGNGRDSVYFASLNHNVTAMDPSNAAIDLCKSKYVNSTVCFINGTLPNLDASHNSTFDVIYSRFVLHAMTETEEIESLICANRVLKNNSSFFIECRSINDPLARKGEVISPTERIHGHYRRFIVLDDLIKRLNNAGFNIESAIEANNLAVLGDDNPYILRVHAKKY